MNQFCITKLYLQQPHAQVTVRWLTVFTWSPNVQSFSVTWNFLQLKAKHGILLKGPVDLHMKCKQWCAAGSTFWISIPPRDIYEWKQRSLFYGNALSWRCIPALLPWCVYSNLLQNVSRSFINSAHLTWHGYFTHVVRENTCTSHAP